MSNTSCGDWLLDCPVTDSPWHGRCWLASGVLLGGLPLLSAMPFWLALPLAWLAGQTLWWGWQRRLRPVRLRASPRQLVCDAGPDGLLQGDWPLPGMACRYWISVALPGRRRRRWLVLFADQLSGDDFRRLRVLLR